MSRTIDELTIIKVKTTILSALLSNLDIESITEKNALSANSAMNKLKNYLFGWGIADTPDESDDYIELCELLDADTERKRRALWVQHIVCKDEEEENTLLRRIMNYNDKDIEDGDNRQDNS